MKILKFSVFFQFTASIHIHPPKIPVINQDINKDYKPKQKPGNFLKNFKDIHIISW